MRKISSNNNLFWFPKDVTDAVVITTNGMVKSNGRAVMGAGIAKSARDTFLHQDIDDSLGRLIKSCGNHAFDLGVYSYLDVTPKTIRRILTMPTKNDWRDKSDLNLIIQSCRELVQIADETGLKNIYLPCPGCGCGGLDWSLQVEPAIKDILDDRFIVVISDRKAKY